MTRIIPRECHIIFTIRCYKTVVKQTVYFEVHIFKHEKYRSVHKKVVKNKKFVIYYIKC